MEGRAFSKTLVAMGPLQIPGVIFFRNEIHESMIKLHYAALGYCFKCFITVVIATAAIIKAVIFTSVTVRVELVSGKFQAAK